MKYRKVHASSPPNPEAETQNNKHSGLPFLRASNPVKRCPEPSENVSEARQEDPFSHLLHANDLNSDQSNNPHGEASRSLGSLAGQRVCRRESPNVGDVFLNSHRGVYVLPPFSKLMSKKKGPVKKQKKTTTDGPWKLVDEHVAQLRRKASYLNRSEELITTQETTKVPRQKPSKVVMKPERDLNKPSHSQDMATTSSIAVIFDEIKGVISSAHQANETKNETCALSSVPSTSDSLPSSSHIDRGSPAWKPVLVVGKSPGISSDEKPRQAWQNNVKQEQMEIPSLRSSSNVNRTLTPHTNSVHEQDSSDNRDKFEFAPQLGESSFHRVPGSAHIDSLSSPWLNMWSPPQKTEKNEE